MSATQAYPRHPRVGFVLGIAAAVSLGLMAIFVRLLLERDVPLSTILAFRFVPAAIVLWGAVTVGPARQRAASRADGLGLLMGTPVYAAQAGLFFGALQHLEAPLAALLLYMYPVLVVAVELVRSVVRLTPGELCSFGCIASGLVLLLVAPAEGGIPPGGAGLALGSAACLGVFLLMSARALPSSSPTRLAALAVSGPAVVYGGFALTAGTLTFEHSLVAWVSLLGLGVVSTALAFVLTFGSVRALGASRSAMVLTSEPLFTVAVAAAVLDEVLGPVQAVGAGAVLVGVVLLQRRFEWSDPSFVAT